MSATEGVFDKNKSPKTWKKCNQEQIKKSLGQKRTAISEGILVRFVGG
jgi:hypothetical protein